MSIQPPTTAPIAVTRRRIGELAVALGCATADEVERVAATTRGTGRRLGEALCAAGVIDDEQLAHLLAASSGLPYVDLRVTPVDVGAATLVDAGTARRYRALPIAHARRGTVRVAVDDPANAVAAGTIGLITGMQTEPVIVSAPELDDALARVGTIADPTLEDPARPPAGEPPLDPGVVDLERDDDAPVIKLVHSVIGDAIHRGASDVHFDVAGRELKVKLRIDGVLSPATTVPARLAPKVVARVKIMAGLDIAERRAPQDGRIRLRLDGRTVDLRVVTVPVSGGEAVVVRILDQGARPRSLADLGLRDADRERLEQALSISHGAVLVTGPTGSGKTTTLYGLLAGLNDGERSVITVEDPVEYEIPDAKQVQVGGKTGLTFATALRTLLRADPDIIMVGEMRDRETARIGIEAALTGHLVLSTLHTNDAAGALVRLGDMGVEPYLTASAVRGVVAQRLLRRLCPDCCVPLDTTRGLPGWLGELRPGDAHAPGGCASCRGTGYRGRIAVYEVLLVDDDLRRLSVAGADADVLAEAARAGGMRTLHDDAQDKVRAGLTSPAEVLRVLGAPR